MTAPYITVITDRTSHYGRNTFLGITDYISLLSGKFDVMFYDHSSWDIRKPAGVIAMIYDKKILQILRDRRIKVVNISSRIPARGVPMVISDARGIGRLAALHLLAAGFCQFGCYGAKGVKYLSERCQGFVQALGVKGRQCKSFLYTEQSDYVKLAHEKRQLQQWIARLPKPVGIFCCSDWKAWDIYDACKEMGLKIPFDVALVGVDNDEFLCNTYVPTLSSVDTNARRIGYEAAALLIRLLDGQPAPPRPVLIPPLGVIRRQSSDVFISNDPHISDVVQYIRRHIDDPLKVNQLLKLVPLSRRILEQRFHRRLGWSMRAEIHRCKIERVKQLLLGTSLPLEKIAVSTGFSSLSHMANLFRNKTGMTLRKYRIHSRYPGLIRK